MLEHLLSPVRLGPVELPNRIVSTAHQTTLVHDHLPTDEFVAYHEARAAGGTGMIVLEATAVHESGRLTAHTLAGYQPEIVAGYRRVADGRPPARDASLRPALSRRPRADRLSAQAGRGRAVGGPEPALPRRAPGAHLGRDRRDRRRVRPLRRAGGRGRARRDRALGRARLPLRAVLHAGAQPPRGRVGGGAAAPRRRRGGRAERGTRSSRSASGSRPTPRPPWPSRPSSPASWTTSRSPSATRPPIAARRESSRRRRSRRAPSPGSRRRSGSGLL